jgi:hypothetical protein
MQGHNTHVKRARNFALPFPLPCPKLFARASFVAISALEYLFFLALDCIYPLTFICA